MTVTEIRQRQAVLGWAAGIFIFQAILGCMILLWAFDLFDIPLPFASWSDLAELSFDFGLMNDDLLGCIVGLSVAIFGYQKACQSAGVKDVRVAWAELRPSAGSRKKACISEMKLAWEALQVAACMSPASKVAPVASLSDSEIQVVVASALSAARKNKAMTQEHLAKAAMVSARTVQRAEANGRLSYENLRSLCSVLEISIPVPEGRETAIERPAAWKGVGQPIALLLALKCSGLFGVGWFWNTWRARLIHIGASLVLTCVVAWFTAGIWLPWQSQTWDMYIGILLISVCSAVGSVLLGVAWRAPSARHATLNAILAAAVLAMPVDRLVRTSGYLEAKAIGTAGELRAFSYISETEKMGAAQVDRDCTRFMALDYMNVSVRPDMTGVQPAPDKEIRFVSAMLTHKIMIRDFHLNSPLHDDDFDPAKWHAVWQGCEAKQKQFELSERARFRQEGH